MRRTITTIATGFIVLILSAKANAGCQTDGPRRHCSSVSALSGTDTFRTQDGKPAHNIHPHITKSSGLFTPRVVPTPQAEGSTNFGIEWRIGSFSCVEYTVSYCTQ